MIITKFTNMLEQRYRETIVLENGIPSIESMKKWDDFLEKHDVKSWPEAGKVGITLKRTLKSQYVRTLSVGHTTYWFHKDFVEKAVVLGMMP